MHPEDPGKNDNLHEDELRRISERIIGSKRRTSIIRSIRNRKLPGERASFGRLKTPIFLAAAALIFLLIFAGQKLYCPNVNPVEINERTSLLACLNAVDRPLLLMDLDQSRGEADPSEDAERIQRLAQAANKSYLNKDYSSALALYEEAFEKDTSNTLYLLCLAHCQAKLNLYPAAVATYDKTLSRSISERKGDLAYTTRFYRSISLLHLNDADERAISDLRLLARKNGYFKDDAAKILTTLGAQTPPKT